MYVWHYKKWLPRFPNSKVLFTDTDSLAYSVQGQDIYAEISKFPEEFDFAEYPKSHPLYSAANMKVVGKMKDELMGRRMLKFVGLRSKLYSYNLYQINKKTKVNELVDKNTAKGVKKIVKDRNLKVQDYERCLRIHESHSVKINSIHSDHHQLFTYTCEKIALSAADNKRYICDNGINTLAHGHYQNK